MELQLGLKLREPRRRGGKREGAGRKPTGKAGVPHRARPKHAARHPVHVTLRIMRGLPNLRRKAIYKEIKRALASTSPKIEFRVVHYTVQKNHFHLLVEAENAAELSRGISALEIRIARALNRHWS